MAEWVHTTPITSQLVDQRLEHRVTDEAFAAARGTDRYQAVCGQVFVPASLAAPPGRPCAACVAILGAAPRSALVPQPSRRSVGLLWRLLRPAPRVR